MSISNASTEERKIFGGAWTTITGSSGVVVGIDIAAVPQHAALAALNVEFSPAGPAKTRFGFQPAHNTVETFLGIFKIGNWLSSLGNKLVWGGNDGANIFVRLLDVSGLGAVVTSVNLGPTGPYYDFLVGAAAGARFYLTSFAISGANSTRVVPGANPVSVISYQSAAYVVDTAFAPPMSYAGGAITEPGAGVVTAGTHLLAYRVTDRSGFLGIFSPNTGGSSPTINTFAPASFTSAGSKNLQWVLNPGGGGWPANGVSVQVLMAPVSDQNRWFPVPGASYALPAGGGASSITATINISDDTLIAGAAAVEATADLNLSISIGNASIVKNIGGRMFYLVDDVDGNGNKFSKLFVSDVGKYQNVTLSQHYIQLPGQQDITNIFQLRNSIFITGAHYTYSTIDTGNVPVTWPVTLVDGAHGAFGPYAVEVASGGNDAFVADQTGVYVFDGAFFSPLPLTFYQQEWNNTNWQAAMEIGQLVDDPQNHRLYVLLPVGALLSTTNHLYCWDYTAGTDPKVVKFAEHTIANASLSNILRIRNDALAGKPMEIWGALNGTSKPIVRMANANDSNPYRDYSAFASTQPINSLWKSSLFPAVSQGAQFYKHLAVDIRVKGAGALIAILRSYNQVNSVVLAPAVTLSTTPDKKPILYADLNGQGYMYEFSTNALDSYFVLSDMTSYYVPWISHD